MLSMLANVMEAITEPLRSNSLIKYGEEFSNGYSRDSFILISILEGYNKSSKFLAEEKFADLIALAETSNDAYVKEVMLPVLRKAHEFRSNPVEFFKRHYGSKASARRIVGYYRPCKVKK